MSSLNPVDLLQKEVQVQLLFNEQPISMIPADQYEITLRSMMKSCHLGFKTNTDNFAETCRIGFSFVSYTKKSKEFQFILQV